jgi:DNA-binding MarR family transcriptional regulator
MRTPTWFLLLEDVREISKKSEINSRSLGRKADIEPSIASAWLCKLSNWGYLKRAGRAEFGGKGVRYELTDYGATVRAPKAERKFHKRAGLRQDPAKKTDRIAANPRETKE